MVILAVRSDRWCCVSPRIGSKSLILQSDLELSVGKTAIRQDAMWADSSVILMPAGRCNWCYRAMSKGCPSLARFEGVPLEDFRNPHRSMPVGNGGELPISSCPSLYNELLLRLGGTNTTFNVPDVPSTTARLSQRISWPRVSRLPTSATRRQPMNASASGGPR